MFTHCFTFDDGSTLTITGNVLLLCHKAWTTKAHAYLKEARRVDTHDYMAVERGKFKCVQRIDRAVPQDPHDACIE